MRTGVFFPLSSDTPTEESLSPTGTRFPQRNPRAISTKKGTFLGKSSRSRGEQDGSLATGRRLAEEKARGTLLKREMTTGKEKFSSVFVKDG